MYDKQNRDYASPDNFPSNWDNFLDNIKTVCEEKTRN